MLSDLHGAGGMVWVTTAEDEDGGEVASGTRKRDYKTRVFMTRSVLVGALTRSKGKETRRAF